MDTIYISREAWLKELKAGDEVCIESHGTLGTFHEVTKIEKVTPTKQFRVGQYLYNATGERREGWSYYSIIPATLEIKQGIKDRKIRYKVKHTEFDKLSQEKINKIYQIIMEEKHE